MKDSQKVDYLGFAETGLLVFVNVFLNIFGWCIGFTQNEEGEFTGMVPVRAKTRGYDEQVTLWSYEAVTKFMGREAFNIYQEVFSKEEKTDVHQEEPKPTEEARETPKEEAPVTDGAQEEGKKDETSEGI